MSEISSKNLVGQIIKSLIHIYDEKEAKAMAYRCLDLGWSCSPTDILMEKLIEISTDDWEEKLCRLQSGEPLQYVMGSEFFRDRKFKLNPNTLIPRPETEELYLKVLPLIEKHHRVLDVGTGSGCLAITLGLETSASIFAWDISKDALTIAEQNASQLSSKVKFELQDIFEWENTHGHWDFIISNPPYVLEEEMANIKANVLKFEPHIALFVPNDDPLKFYRVLGDFAWNRLNTGGWLAVEINRTFGQDTIQLFQKIGFIKLSLYQDFNKNDRFILAQK